MYVRLRLSLCLLLFECVYERGREGDKQSEKWRERLNKHVCSYVCVLVHVCVHVCTYVKLSNNISPLFFFTGPPCSEVAITTACSRADGAHDV